MTTLAVMYALRIHGEAAKARAAQDWADALKDVKKQTQLIEEDATVHVLRNRAYDKAISYGRTPEEAGNAADAVEAAYSAYTEAIAAGKSEEQAEAAGLAAA